MQLLCYFGLGLGVTGENCTLRSTSLVTPATHSSFCSVWCPVCQACVCRSAGEAVIACALQYLTLSSYSN